jgi:hypothetical protein
VEDNILKSSVIVAVKEQVSCDLGGEAAVLNFKNSMYYGLNAVGVRIWNLIQEPKTANEVLSVLLEEYDVESDRCERDLLALLQELAAHGLVEAQYLRDGTAG